MFFWPIGIKPQQKPKGHTHNKKQKKIKPCSYYMCHLFIKVKWSHKTNFSLKIVRSSHLNSCQSNRYLRKFVKTGTNIEFSVNVHKFQSWSRCWPATLRRFSLLESGHMYKRLIWHHQEKQFCHPCYKKEPYNRSKHSQNEWRLKKIRGISIKNRREKSRDIIHVVTSWIDWFKIACSSCERRPFFQYHWEDFW